MVLVSQSPVCELRAAACGWGALSCGAGLALLLPMEEVVLNEVGMSVAICTVDYPIVAGGDAPHD